MSRDFEPGGCAVVRSPENVSRAAAGQLAQPLPVPKNTQEGWANDINNFGDIVGQLDIYKLKGFIDGPGNYHPYLWKDGDMIDLEKQVDLAGWDRLWGATQINDAGIIAGHGRYDVEHRGFLLIPTDPAPPRYEAPAS